MLTCFAPPQQAAAQNSFVLDGSTITIADAAAVGECCTATFAITVQPVLVETTVFHVDYLAISTVPELDLGRDRPFGPGAVTIQEGETSLTLAVPIRDDDVTESRETFQVIFRVDNISGADAIGTITDTDESVVSLRPEAEGPGTEGGTITFTAELDSQVAEAFSLGWTATTAAGDTATVEDDLVEQRGTVTFPANSRTATFKIPVTDDAEIEDEETFTVSLSGPPTGLVAIAPNRVTIDDNSNSARGTISRNSGPSVLIGPRQIGAGTALRRHAGRFDSLTGTVAQSRLDARKTRRLSASKNAGDGALAVGGGHGEGPWGAWIDVAWAGFDGRATGRQADIYGGVDYLGGGAGRHWLIGALIGYEVADLEIGEATYRSDYTHLGFYGGARLLERLLFDGAATWGRATPEVAQGDVSASYDAHRFTARGALTGDFGFNYGLWTGSVKVQPQLGLLYSREVLGAFTDSVGGVAEREALELGRFNAGPRLTWAFEGGQVTGQVTGGARV